MAKKISADVDTAPTLVVTILSSQVEFDAEVIMVEDDAGSKVVMVVVVVVTVLPAKWWVSISGVDSGFSATVATVVDSTKVVVGSDGSDGMVGRRLV